MHIEENLSFLMDRIDRAAARSGRNRDAISLVAVSKTVDAERIQSAISLGLHDFGENRVQEMRRKETVFQGQRLHMIGQLQTNKVRQLPSSVVLIQSIDRLSLIQELERIGARDHRSFTGLIEVGMAGETQKGGCAPEAVEELLEAVEACEHLRIEGLMTVAPQGDAEEVRPIFTKMRELFEKLKSIGYNKTQMEILSMGMTHDFEVAIEEGATMIRVGTGLFGARMNSGGGNQHGTV